jgi:tocopherol O-methyltransferase
MDLERETFATNQVAALYEVKTTSILQRYGPGPRVHYHTGFIDEVREPITISSVRAQLVESQEQVLKYASGFWNLRSYKCREILDVGCGLGGSAIFWAQEYGAHVTAVTIAPSHIELISEFAKRAGVESQVTPVLCEASEVPGENCFDAAVAIESSSLFPRWRWFQRLGRLLRSGGSVCIFDCFLERPDYEEPFNRHWCAQIGTLEEYVDAAKEAGFSLEAVENTSLRTASFWKTTCKLIRAEATSTKPDPLQFRTIERSLAMHELMRRGLVEGGLLQLLMSFIKR